MSDTQSALNGATFSGIADIREIPPRGMITMRGDLGSAPVGKAVKAAVGTSVPGIREIILGGEKGAAWMSPDELLLLTPHGETPAAIAAATKALGKAHAMVVEVSDARASFEISGAFAREVLSKLMPVDFHPDHFGEGMIRRSHLAQVPAAVWMTATDTFHLVCFRSVARYVFDALSAAAAEGSQVNHL